MGCCMSAGAGRRVPSPSPTVAENGGIEEETVKEVVVHSVCVPDPPPHLHATTPPIAADEQLPVPDSKEDLRLPIPDSKPLVKEDEHLHTPDPSDVCSLSHSFSTATTATTATVLDYTGADDEALSKPRPVRGTGGRDRVSRSPAGRPAQHSPLGKRGQSRPRLVQRRPSSAQVSSGERRNVGPGALRRGGLQDGPARRRSRSPATGGRMSPRKKGKGITESSQSGDAGCTENGSGVKKKKEEAKDGSSSSSAAATDTIDNPLVSLECFIFL